MSNDNQASTDPAFRTRDGLRQVVMVGRLTYAWDGVDLLEVGDVVQLPANWSNPNGWQGEVTAIGSAYPGELRLVERRIRTAARNAQLKGIATSRARPAKRDKKLDVTRPNG